MKRKKIISPIDLLIVIIPRHKGNKVCKILNDYKIYTHVNCIGYGTAESTIADLFGFGIKERDIVFAIIPTDKGEKLLDVFENEFKFEEKDNGLAMTLPINSIEKKLFDLIKIGE